MMNTEPENTTKESANVDPADAAAQNATAGNNEQPETIELSESEPPNETEQPSVEQKLAEAEKQILMAHADLENYRKRSRRESQEQLRYASLNIMGEFLSAVDNLNRAIEATNPETADRGLLDGVTMVAAQITGILESHGCKKIEAVGQPFDPNRHQAIQMQPSDEFEADTVMQEMLPGYVLHDRVIRPSQVFVSTGKK